MPKLYEYQGKRLLKGAGVGVPEGADASSPAEARKGVSSNLHAGSMGTSFD